MGIGPSKCGREAKARTQKKGTNLISRKEDVREQRRAEPDASGAPISGVSEHIWGLLLPRARPDIDGVVNHLGLPSVCVFACT